MHYCIPNVSVFYNLSYLFFSGPTELEILMDIEEIVEHALPIHKLRDIYSDLNASKNLFLNRMVFCQSRIDVCLMPRLDVYLLIYCFDLLFWLIIMYFVFFCEI